MRKIWNTMLKGLVAILPIGLTLYLVYWLAVTAERLFSGVLRLLLPDSAYWPGLGLLAGLVLLYLAGLAVNGFLVRRALRYGDELFARIPVVKTLYVYSLGWLRQEENMYLSCPPEEARKLDPQLAALVGYAMSNYALGYYTPPLPAGAGPETVPPEWSLGVLDDAEGSLGGAALLAEVIARTSEKREAQVKPVG